MERCFGAEVPLPIGSPDCRDSPSDLEHPEETIALSVPGQLGNRCPHLPVDRQPGAIREPAEANLTAGTFRRCPTRPISELEAQSAQSERATIELKRSLERSGFAGALGGLEPGDDRC